MSIGEDRGGECESCFAAVRDVFARSFETGEVGAALAVTIAGRPVIDLWGGHRDAARRQPCSIRRFAQSAVIPFVVE